MPEVGFEERKKLPRIPLVSFACRDALAALSDDMIEPSFDDTFEVAAERQRAAPPIKKIPPVRVSIPGVENN